MTTVMGGGGVEGEFAVIVGSHAVLSPSAKGRRMVTNCMTVSLTAAVPEGIRTSTSRMNRRLEEKT